MFTLGPFFNLFAEATLDIDTEVHLGVDLAYHVDNLQLVFPPSDGHSSSAKATPQDSRKQLESIIRYLSDTSFNAALTLSVSPGVASNATITAHLIPSVCILFPLLHVLQTHK